MPRLLDHLTEADNIRMSALSDMFKRHGFSQPNADVRARTTYLVQIGYISMQVYEDPSVRMQRISEYVTIMTGQVPQQRDLDRFASRHPGMSQDAAAQVPAADHRWKSRGNGPRRS